MLQSIQKLEDRLLGQKDVNSRLLSEIEKTKEEKQKETKRICEEKEREFRIKTDQLKNKLDLQIVKLRKEHSTTEILKAEFTSIRRDLESQITARDVKIEELRRQIRTDNERENGSKEVESDMAGSRGEQDQVEKNAEDKEELKRKESKIRVLENALTDENKKFVDLQEDMERRERLLADASESCRRLKRQKNDLDEQVQNQNSEIVLLREYLASRDRRIVQMAADLSRRDRRIMTLLKDLRQQQSPPQTGPIANAVKETSSSSSSLTLDQVMAGKTEEASLSDRSSDERNNRMEEAMSNLEKQLQTLKQYKSDADERIQTLLRDLEESKTYVDEVKRLEREKDKLQEYVTNFEKDMGKHDLSPQSNVIKRLQTLFLTKEEEFTAELAFLQIANKDMQGIMKEKEELAAKTENMY
nr:tropomyosin-like [Lytechinus pictus]